MPTAYAGCLTKLFLFYKGMLATGIGPGLSAYNALLAALACRGIWKQAETILAEMRDVGCKPNELAYSLPHAYANGKEIGQMCGLANDIYSGLFNHIPCF